MTEVKRTRNKIKNFPVRFLLYVSDEELKKIDEFKRINNFSRSKIIKDHLLIGGLMDNDENIIKSISMIRRSPKDRIYKNAIAFNYTEKMEQKLKELEEKTGAYKTSLIRTFLQNSKLI
jgi:wyosine [tRNA(Phe)-imidazoG37] synthetase (radical SAM superfamily)